MLLFPSASDARGRLGLALVINHSARSGEVAIRAFDDHGVARDPLTLAIGANESVHFNSRDLENGNATKGLSGGAGPGEGHWRLELSSGLDIEVLSYVRTADGFLTAMHDAALAEEGRHRVAFFNPGEQPEAGQPAAPREPGRRGGGGADRGRGRRGRVAGGGREGDGAGGRVADVHGGGAGVGGRGGPVGFDR